MGEIEAKNKKKLVKKSIDIESEFIGKAIEPKKKKERKDDLTDEINKFLSQPINLDSIKRILMRLQGQISDYDLANSKMSIFGISTVRYYSEISIMDYLIRINYRKKSNLFYLGHFILCDLCFFSPSQLDKSILRQKMAHTIRDWLEKNLNKISIKIGYDNVFLS